MMDFLMRDSVDMPEGFWEELDEKVVSTLKLTLTGRKFIPMFGPLGAGTNYVQIDVGSTDEIEEDGFVKVEGRNTAPMSQIFEDFSILWRDIEASEKLGLPIDLAKAQAAAQKLALKEDRLLFYGNDFLGATGLLKDKGVQKLKRSNWAEGENAYLDIVKALSMFSAKGIIGRYSLVLSPDVYAQLHHVVAGLGVVEMERISKMVSGRIFQSAALDKGTAFMVCSEAQYLDVAIGKDIETAYLEARDMNHIFRVLETVALRLKNKDAVLRFE